MKYAFMRIVLVGLMFGLIGYALYSSLLAYSLYSKSNKIRDTDTRSVPVAARATAAARVTNAVYDNGMSDWNTPNSDFGRWAYRTFRVLHTNNAYIVEMNLNERVGGPGTSQPPEWVTAIARPRAELWQAQSDIRRGLMVDKAIADAFEGFGNRTSIGSTNTNTAAAPTLPAGWRIQYCEATKEYAWVDADGYRDTFGRATTNEAITDARCQYEFRLHKQQRNAWKDVICN